MGLDMYLSVRKYVSRLDFSKAYDEEKGFSHNPEFTSLLEHTGLDDLIERDESAGMYVEVPVMYWRKANAIHKWFVDTLADGVDECQPISVSIDHLKQLLEVCEEALADKENPDEYLPTEGGFFFGSTEYDDDYWTDIEYTATRLKELIGLMEKHDIDWGQYQASW